MKSTAGDQPFDIEKIQEDFSDFTRELGRVSRIADARAVDFYALTNEIERLRGVAKKFRDDREGWHELSDKFEKERDAAIAERDRLAKESENWLLEKKDLRAELAQLKAELAHERGECEAK